jgi:hypothetical protein
MLMSDNKFCWAEGKGREGKGRERTQLEGNRNAQRTMVEIPKPCLQLSWGHCI